MHRTVRFWDLEKFQVVSCIEEEATPVRYNKFLLQCTRQRPKLGAKGEFHERENTGEKGAQVHHISTFIAENCCRYSVKPQIEPWDLCGSWKFLNSLSAFS